MTALLQRERGRFWKKDGNDTTYEPPLRMGFGINDKLVASTMDSRFGSAGAPLGHAANHFHLDARPQNVGERRGKVADGPCQNRESTSRPGNPRSALSLP